MKTYVLCELTEFKQVYITLNVKVLTFGTKVHILDIAVKYINDIKIQLA